MVETMYVNGFEEFKSAINNITGKEHINVYFTGSKDQSGVSWCPDCAIAEPHVMFASKNFSQQNSAFMIVEVGDRSCWKDITNKFRTDKSTHLRVIPTLLRWNAHQRLEGDYCKKPDLLEMFFTDTE